TKAAVLAWAGARPAERDAVDARVAADAWNRTGTMISSQDAVGGWPVFAVNVRALTTPINPHTVSGTGYTNLEDWLHGFSAIVEAGGTLAVPSPPTGLRIVG